MTKRHQALNGLNEFRYTQSLDDSGVVVQEEVLFKGFQALVLCLAQVVHLAAVALALPELGESQVEQMKQLFSPC